MAIRLFNQDQNTRVADKRGIYKWLRESAAREGRTIADLNIILTTDERLREQNLEFLGRDYYTDVIAFDYSEKKEGIHGEIYISIDRVRDNAEARKISWKIELKRIMMHGLLHLIGYSDKDSTGRSAMRAREDFYLNLRPE